MFKVRGPHSPLILYFFLVLGENVVHAKGREAAAAQQSVLEQLEKVGGHNQPGVGAFNKRVYHRSQERHPISWGRTFSELEQMSAMCVIPRG